MKSNNLFYKIVSKMHHIGVYCQSVKQLETLLSKISLHL